MNLINCSHGCIYQKDGYCTLDKLNDIVSTPLSDCLYFSPVISTVEQSPQFPDISHRDKP